MLAVSQNFKDAIESETRNIKARITMKGVTYTNSDIFNVEYNSGSITGETFNIGSTFSNNIKVTFSSIIEELLLDDQVKLEFGVVLSDSTIEYVKMGTFFITSYDPQRNDFKTVIEASDKMIQLNGTYASELSYPSTIKKVALEIANKAGLLVNETSFARLSDMPINEPIGYTYRQALGLIAQFECGFALFDRNGLLDIRMLGDPEYTVNPDSYFSKGLTKDETNYQIGGINCKVVTKDGDPSETTTLQSGSTSGAQISLENNVMTQTLLDGMYQKLRNLNYFPFSLSWRGNPALEAGDWITVVDLKGVRLKVPNLNYKLTFSGGLKAVSSANTQTVSASSYQYQGSLQQQIYELSGRIGAAGNHIYDGNAQPILPKEGDLWFKPNGPDTEIRIYQNGEWVFKVSTATNPEIAEAIEQAHTEATEAKTAAQDAVDKANASVTAIEANTQLITDVNAIAENAKTQAQTAATNAQTALTSANTAMTNANKAISDAGKLSESVLALDTIANQAKSDADTALINANKGITDAKTALNKATGVDTRVTTEITNVNNTLATKANSTTLNALSDTVSSQGTAISQNATDIKLKADSTVVNAIKGTVDTQGTLISQNSKDIALKANKTDVDSLTGRVSTAEGSITTMAGQIALKANQADVNTIGGKVSSLESNFTVASGQILALNTKTDGQTTQIGSLQSSYNGLTSTVASVESSLQQNNLVYNSTLQSGSDGWVMHTGFAQSSARNISGNYIINFSLSDNSSSTWYFARSKQVPIGIWKTYAYRVTLMRRTDISNSGNFAVGVEGFDVNGTRVEFKTINTHSSLTDDSWVKYSDSYTFTNPDVKTVCFTLATNGFGHYIACQPILVNDSKVGNFVPDGMDKGQITQMVQDLDGFKTTVANTYADKSTVASQINQSATEVRQDIQSWTNGQLNNYSTIQSTSNSIALAVADKVTQTQFTVLSNQVTSTVSQISNNSNLFSIKKMKVSTAYHPIYTNFLLVEIATDIGASYTASSDHPSSNLWFIPGNNSDVGAATYRVYSGKTVAFVATSSKSYVAIRDTATQNQLSNETYHLKVERGISATDWSPSAQDSATQSQFTQLTGLINLRVSKGDVLSQINLESGRVLIDSKQLLLNADTVKFSGSAFIPNAMIQNLSAEKITAGTLNAANVNVINLNAANITTGTLSGANLSMNLNTGEVQFQKGIIKKADGSFVIDITNGEISSDDSKGGFSLKSGALKLRRNVDNAEYGSINYGFDNDGELNLGLTIVGNEGYMFKTKNYTSSFAGSRAIIGSGIKSNTTSNLTKISLEAQNGISLFGGKTFDSSSFMVPYFSVGEISSDIFGNAQNIKFYSTVNGSSTSFIISPGQIKFTANQTFVFGNFNVVGSKNAIHVTRDGVRATPAYETAESYLGDIGRSYTREDCEIWVEIDLLFSDTVNTDIAYEVFLQAYDDATFWVSDFRSDKFLVKSNKPMSRFAWELKAKRRGYENERLVLQESFDNKMLLDAHAEGAF